MTENMIQRLWSTTPPITRTIFTLATLASFLVYIDVISPFTLQFSPYYISKLQLWRLVTCFFYFGKLNLETLFHIIFLCRYSKMLEESMLISDYIYMIFTIMILLFIVNAFLYVRLSHALSAVITYLWSRKNPYSHVQYMGCIVLHAFYLPFIVPLYSLISERRVPRDDFVGIMVGHIVFYFKYIWPKMGRDFLATPVWLQKLFGEYFEKKNDSVKELNEEVVEDDVSPVIMDESNSLYEKESLSESSSLREFEYGNREEKTNSSGYASNSSDEVGGGENEFDKDEELCEEVTSSFETNDANSDENSSDILEEKFVEKSDDFEEW